MIRLLTGDALEVLATLPTESVHCAVTSPPYYGLRSYLPAGHPAKALEIGQEPTPDLYIEKLVAVFRELRRVLRSDGLLWVVIGDSYANNSYTSRIPGGKHFGKNNRLVERGVIPISGANRRPISGVKKKELIGIPWMLAFALRADGWWLRSENIWHKPAPIPESVRDRTTRAHEHVFMLSKSAHYYFDATAIREPYSDPRENKAGAGGGKTAMRGQAALRPRGNLSPSGSNLARYYGQGGRNKRTVWTVQPAPYRGRHCATFPAALIRPCIAASTSEAGCCSACGTPWRRVVERLRRLGTDRKPGSRAFVSFPGPPHRGLKNHETSIRVETVGWRAGCDCAAGPPVACSVLDPFAGAGTVGCEAGRQFRDAILIELDESSTEEARARMMRELGLFASIELGVALHQGGGKRRATGGRGRGCTAVKFWDDGFPQMATVLDDGRIRAVEVRSETITTRSVQHRGRQTFTVEPGRYCRLFVHMPLSMSNMHLEDPQTTIMDDLPIERDDHAMFRDEASGDVLIAGLGLGMIALACALKPAVKTVTVIEASPLVCRLVLPSLKHIRCWRDKVKIHMANAFDWTPESRRRFDCVWLDIWPNLSHQHIQDYHRLMGKYGEWLRKDGLLGAWAYDLILHPSRHEAKKT